MEVCFYSYFWWCWYLRGLWVSFVTTDEFSVRSQKILQGLMSDELIACLSYFDLFLTNEIVILSKGHKPDKSESHNFLKVRFTNIPSIRLNFAEWQFFLKWVSTWDKLEWLNWLWKFLCVGLSSFNLKRFCSVTDMHDLVVYVKEGLLLAKVLSLENSVDFYLWFWMTFPHSVSYFRFLYRSPPLSLCKICDAILLNIDKVLSINPSDNVFVFRDFNIHQKGWLIYSGGTDRLDELCYNLSQINLFYNFIDL